MLPGVSRGPSQEGQDGQDPAVNFAAVRQPQLHQDAAHVLLDRSLRDPEGLPDSRVRPSLRHQREGLPLPAGQLVSRISGSGASTSSSTTQVHRDPPRIARCSVWMNSATSVAPAFQQVPGALTVRGPVHRLLDFHVRRQHHDRRLLTCRCGSSPAAARPSTRTSRRPAEINQRQVGPLPADEGGSRPAAVRQPDQPPPAPERSSRLARPSRSSISSSASTTRAEGLIHTSIINQAPDVSLPAGAWPGGAPAATM